MLPSPTLTLTIPSIHDDTVLDCRIYAPPNLIAALKSQPSQWRKKAAIVAHPYAPLGGCQDDPVVSGVASELLDEGFFVGTLNFRGAGTSKGRPSWTAKPETDDYISFVGLMMYFMHYLSLPRAFCAHNDLSQDDDEPYLLTPIPSHALPPPRPPISPSSWRHSVPKIRTHPPSDSYLEATEGMKSPSPVSLEPTPLLLLGGYSYGALVVRRLPPLQSIIKVFATATPGTAASEIRLRAQQLAKQQNELLALRATSLEEKAAQAAKNNALRHNRGRSLQSDAILSVRKYSTTSSVRLGGEETDPELRRSSHDSQSRRRSFSFEPERIRKSIDRFRSLSGRPNDQSKNKFLKRKNSTPTPSMRHSSESGSSSAGAISLEQSKDEGVPFDPTTMESVRLERIKEAYLLISPPQGLVAKLITMWTFTPRQKAKSPLSKNMDPLCEEEHKLALNDTLAIFGNQDDFSSNKKFLSWADGLRDEGDSHFQYVEVDGAGHFWHEEGVMEDMRRSVKDFALGL